MIYVWAGIALVGLFFVWQIIRWYNLPATIEAREKAKAARAQRWANRPRLFGRRRAEMPVDPLPKPVPEASKPRRPRRRQRKKEV